MRLYLLPISTRRTLLYCQKLQPSSASASAAITSSSSSSSSSSPGAASPPPSTTKQKQSWGDYIQTKAALTWASWEKKDSGWQKSVVNYGNHLLRKLPYEEWALKSVPPLTKARKRQLEMLVAEQAQREGGFEKVEGEGKGGKRGKLLEGENDKVEVVYPAGLITKERVPRILHKLATEREGHHKKWFWYCLAGMPVTLPIGILPLVPNLPFFYLCYRAWSHHRALSGGYHLSYLLQHPSRLLSFRPSPLLDEIYSSQKFPLPFTPQPTTGPEAETVKHPDPAKVVEAMNGKTEKETGGGVNMDHVLEEGEMEDGEVMLLSQENGRRMVQLLEVPELEVELERAIWQVETAIEKKSGEVAGGKKRVGAPDVDETKTKKEGKGQ